MTRAASGMVAGLLIGYVAFGAAEAAAQQAVGYGVTSNNPNVFVNNDLLNSLGPAGPAAVLPYYGAAPYAGGYGATPYAGGYGAQPYAGGYGGQPIAAPQGTFVLTRPGTLLFPPAAYPRSHLVNRNTAVALSQPSASSQAPALPQLTAPQPIAQKPAVPQVATRQAQSAATPPPTGLAPPPPVPAGSKKKIAASSAPAAPPPPKPGDTAEGVPPPPAPASGEEIVAEVAGEPRLTPPPPPETATEGASGTIEAVSAVPPPPPPTSGESGGAEAPAAVSQEAALPPAGGDPVEGELRLLFKAGKADLSQEVKSALQGLAKRLLGDGNARVQLLAYATSSDDSPSRARRLSLSRALAVRAFLIDQGVRSTRMDVRALGDKAENGAKDRVDIQPARR